MEKQISHEDKLDFYKEFNSTAFQTRLNKIKQQSFITSFTCLNICFTAAIICGLFNPLLFLFAIPGIVAPITTALNGHFKQKLLIESLNLNISYKDYKKMINSEEWSLLGYELCFKDKNITHYAQNSELVVEEKVKNVPRSLNCCIIKDENENLVKKAEKRHKKGTETIVNNSIKEEDFVLTLDLLNNFLKQYNKFTFKEFYPCKIFDINNLYTVILKTPGGVELEFLVSYENFINIDYEIDLSDDWTKYLNLQYNKENDTKKTLYWEFFV